MIKRICLLLFLCNGLLAQQPQPVLSDRERIQQLLKERNERFDIYTKSLENKSGIFGGKTKKDLQQSQLILVEIVRLDNDMISVLNRQIDFKSFEKTEMNYQSLQEQEEGTRLRKQLDYSQQELLKMRQQASDLKTSIRTKNRVVFLALTTAVLSLAIPLIFRKSRVKKSPG